jgi:hypothetical protein
MPALLALDVYVESIAFTEASLIRDGDSDVIVAVQFLDYPLVVINTSGCLRNASLHVRAGKRCLLQAEANATCSVSQKVIELQRQSRSTWRQSCDVFWC